MIPENLKIEIIELIHTVKLSGKKKKNGTYKTDLFNHSHYNLLFLKLNSMNIEYLKLSKNDLDLHLKCLGLDLMQPISQERLDKINLLKYWITEITI